MNKNIFVLISVLLISSYVCAYPLEVSFPKDITLVDKQVSVEMYVFNSSSVAEIITLTGHTTPFPISFSETQFRLNPNESKRIAVNFTPLTNYLDAVYSSSIEIRSANYYNKYTFNITQKSNRVCSIDLQYFVIYVPSTDQYKLELILKKYQIKCN